MKTANKRRRWRRRGSRLIDFELHPGAAIPMTFAKKIQTMIKTLLILIGLQISPLISAEVVVCYRFLSDSQVHNVQQARKILKESDVSRIQAYIATIKNTTLEHVSEFTYIQGAPPPEDADQEASEPGVSISGSFFTVNGGTRVRMNFREVKSVGITGDNKPRLWSSSCSDNFTLDEDGYGILRSWPGSEGTADVVLIYFPQLHKLQTKKANKAEMATPRKPSD